MPNTQRKLNMPLWAVILAAAAFLVAPALAVIAFICLVYPPLAAFLSSNTLWVLGTLAVLLVVVGVASIPALVLGSEVTRLSASVRRMAEDGRITGRRLPRLRNLGPLITDLESILERAGIQESDTPEER